MNWNEMQALRSLKPPSDAVPVSDAFAMIGTEEGRARFLEVLRSRPFPHYEADPANPELLIQIAEDGTRIRGRFFGREFRAAE